MHYTPILREFYEPNMYILVFRAKVKLIILGSLQIFNRVPVLQALGNLATTKYAIKLSVYIYFNLRNTVCMYVMYRSMWYVQ